MIQNYKRAYPQLIKRSNTRLFSIKEFYKFQTNYSTAEGHQQVKRIKHMVEAVMVTIHYQNIPILLMISLTLEYFTFKKCTNNI
jgi:hypothetical protein